MSLRVRGASQTCWQNPCFRLLAPQPILVLDLGTITPKQRVNGMHREFRLVPAKSPRFASPRMCSELTPHVIVTWVQDGSKGLGLVVYFVELWGNFGRGKTTAEDTNACAFEVLVEARIQIWLYGPT